MLDIGDSQTQDNRPTAPLAGLIGQALRSRVIPHLQAVYSVDPPHPPGLDAESLARACADEADAAPVMRALHAAGAAPDAILFHWLPVFACHLGRFWAEDSMSFVDVTIGMSRIEREARALAAADPTAGLGPLALVSPPPRAQHRFGALLVEIALRRAGWRVHAGPFESDAALTGELAARPYRLFALSVGSTDELPRSRALIRAARAARPGLLVMAGGAAFTGDLDPVADLGADAGAADARAVAAAARARLPAGA